MRRNALATALGIGLVAGLSAFALADDPPKGKPQAPTYEATVRPLFDKYGCLDCHNPQKVRKSKVDLTTYTTAMKDVRAGDIDSSKLIKMIVNGKMPPKKSGKHVSDEDLATLKAWIAAGAPEK